MVDVDEPTRIQQRLDAEWRNFDDAELTDTDRAAIEAFVEYRRDNEGVSRRTLSLDLGSLRRAAERAEIPLTDMGLADVDAFFTLLASPKSEGGYGLGPDGSGMYDYKRALRLFYRFLHKRDEWGDYPWHDEVTLPDRDMQGAKKRDEMLTGEEIESLKNAAGNPRDRALIALLGDIGGRIGMLLSLRLGDLHLEGDEPFLTPNRDVEDGLKGLDIDEIPIFHARADLRQWVNQYHPERQHDGEVNPRAPVWASMRAYDPDDPEAYAISSTRARSILKEAADTAGVDKPVDPHNFRRTASTRLSNSDRLSPQEIRQITGWSASQVSNMLDVYDYTSDSERNSKIHQALGFSDGGEGEDDPLAVESVVCGNCTEPNPSDDRFCGRCGAPLTEDAKALQSNSERAVVDGMVDEDDADKRELRSLVREVIDEDPSLVDGDAHD